MENEPGPADGTHHLPLGILAAAWPRLPPEDICVHVAHGPLGSEGGGGTSSCGPSLLSSVYGAKGPGLREEVQLGIAQMQFCPPRPAWRLPAAPAGSCLRACGETMFIQGNGSSPELLTQPAGLTRPSEPDADAAFCSAVAEGKPHRVGSRDPQTP